MSIGYGSDRNSGALHCHTFFGLRCEVWTSGDLMKWYPGCPWRFRVWDRSGNVHNFAGLPNYCRSVRSAMMRAWYRAKWMTNGEYEKHYM
jgi:hypothetical protein